MADASYFRTPLFRRIVTRGILTTIILLSLLPPGRAAAFLPVLLALYAKPGGLSSGNCDDWSVACDLPYAISLATGAPNYGYDIYLEEGTYKPTSGLNPYASFDFHFDDVSLYGGYASTDHSRDPAAHPSILSGDLAGNDTFCNPYLISNGDNSRRVVYVSSLADNILLDGLTIAGGHNVANDLVDITTGAGLWSDAVSGLRLKDVVFYCNHAEEHGGGMFDRHGATLLNVTFDSNSANDLGGAYWVYGSSSLTNVTFAGNWAHDGGAMYVSGGAPTLTNVTFHNNNPSDGTGNGAAVFVASGASAVLTNVILWLQSGYLPFYNEPGATSSIDHGVVKYGCPSGSTCTNLETADPALQALGYYGGFTPTVPLGTTSSAIDTGDDAACAAAPVNGIDQRGVARPQGPHCDIGAYEVDFAAPVFADMPVAGREWMEPWVNSFYYAGITTGCGSSPLIYCPEGSVTRAAMAVFILRAEHGASYVPPATTHTFSDMPVAGKEWMEPWVDQLYAEGITTGCGASPLRYCPENPVTRSAMAVFLLRVLEGSSYTPPAATHTFADLPVAGKEWMEPWVDEFYSRGITTGCGAAPLIYCPENAVTHAAMAVFIDRAYSLYP